MGLGFSVCYVCATCNGNQKPAVLLLQFLCATCVLRVIETTNLEWPLPVAAVACVKASSVFGLISSLRLRAPNRGEQGQGGRLPRWAQVMMGPRLAAL